MAKVLKLHATSHSPVRVCTLTRRSTDEEHQPYSSEMQDQRLGSYMRHRSTPRSLSTSVTVRPSPITAGPPGIAVRPRLI